mmetsp:Transcript_157993/g.383665  ORF Transcript_157993/g.383665 Transcript_157993/m.383665 type:complete len:332 (-) Transcript_157993:546-1541(-)
MLHLLEHMPAYALGLLRCSPHHHPVWLSHNRLGELLHGLGVEGIPPGEQVEQHAAYGPDVAALAGVALPDLWCHEGWSPGDDVTAVRGVGEHLGEAKVHHDHVDVVGARLLWGREHDILRLQVLVDDGLGVAVSHGGQRMLHDLGDPELVGPRVHGLQRLDVAGKVSAAARLHQEVEILLIFKVLEDAQHVRVVQLLQHRKFLPHLGLRRLGSPCLGLGNDLADPDALVTLAVALRLVRHQVHGAEGTFAKLLLHLVDVLESLEILLEELPPPFLVSLLRPDTVPRLLRLHLLLDAEEAQQAEEQRLELLATNALSISNALAVLLKQCPHL